MSWDERKEIIKEIQEERGTKVISYITSDRPGASYSIFGDVVSILHEHILALEKDDDLKLDLFIYSRGGASDIPWTIVSMFREYAKQGSFSVLIPYRAHSAATMIALGADEIVMSKKAEMGPIDITHQGPYNPRDQGNNNPLPISVEDVNGYFSLIEKAGCNRPDEKMKGFELLANSVHPLALGKVSRSLEQTKLVAERLLNTRSDPFTGEENELIVKRISSEIYSHSHAINRTEAIEYLGLKQVKNAEDDKININKEMWQLYNEYKDLFELENPLMKEEYLISNNLNEHTWTDLNMVAVESCKRSDLFKQDLYVRKLRNIPPEIQLGMNI